MSKNKEENIPPLLEAFGCAAMVAAVVTLFIVFGLIIKGAAQEQIKANEEKINTIEGMISSVETRKIPDPFDDKENDKGIRIRIGKFEPYRTTIKFEDGREKEFEGVTEKPILCGFYTFVQYDDNNKIRSATTQPVK